MARTGVELDPAGGWIEGEAIAGELLETELPMLAVRADATAIADGLVFAAPEGVIARDTL
jgi:hypothetical protein